MAGVFIRGDSRRSRRRDLRAVLVGAGSWGLPPAEQLRADLAD